MKPRAISKLNTAIQVLFIASVLAIYAARLNPDMLVPLGTVLVAILTFVSGAYYMRDWFLHTNTSKGAQ